MGVLAVGGGVILSEGLKSYQLASSRKAALQSARLSMERMVRDIRLIPSAASIDSFSSTAFQFDISGENNISYSRNGNNLERSGGVLASSCTGLIFTYLDSNGNPTSTQANIRQVQIEMTMTAANNQGTYTMRSRIFPRQFSTDYAGYQ